MLPRSKSARLLLIRRCDALVKRSERHRIFRATTRFKKKNTMRHVPGQHRAQVVGLPDSAAREEQRDGPRVNQQSYGGPITIRRALISHNAPFFSPQGGPRSDGLHVAEKGLARASIDFHDFSISFSMASKDRGLSLRPTATFPV